MERSFYQFVLSFRVEIKATKNQHSLKLCSTITVFRKTNRLLTRLSRYLEEKADSEMPSVVFDELFAMYIERFQ